MAELCNKAMPHNVFRCDRARGHDGHHECRHPDGKLAASWPNARAERRVALARGRRPQKETYEHELAEAFTDGIKADRISNQILIHGRAFCIECGTNLSQALEVPVDLSYATNMVLFELALETAMQNSAKHHDKRRRGHGYRPNKHGNDFGHDCPVFIRAPICHPCHTGAGSELHRGPQLGEATA